MTKKHKVDDADDKAEDAPAEADATAKSAPPVAVVVRLAQPVVPHRLAIVMFKDANGVEVARANKGEMVDEVTMSVTCAVPESAVSCDILWGDVASSGVYGVPLTRE